MNLCPLTIWNLKCTPGITGHICFMKKWDTLCYTPFIKFLRWAILSSCSCPIFELHSLSCWHCCSYDIMKVIKGLKNHFKLALSKQKGHTRRLNWAVSVALHWWPEDILSLRSMSMRYEFGNDRFTKLRLIGSCTRSFILYIKQELDLLGALLRAIFETQGPSTSLWTHWLMCLWLLRYQRALYPATQETKITHLYCAKTRYCVLGK